MHDLIYGRNAVYETLRATRRQVFELQVAETARQAGRMAQILDLATSRKLKITRVPHPKLPGAEVNHQGVALEAGPYPYADLADISDCAQKQREQLFVLLLDSLQDPQNFGGLLRTAEVTGVHGVVIPLAAQSRSHPRSSTPRLAQASTC